MTPDSTARRALAIGGLALAAVLSTAFVAPRLVWNVTASAPVGLYLRLDSVPHTGDFALVRTPEPVRKLAAQRGYLPADVPMVKTIAARFGDYVCVRGEAILINGKFAAARLAADSAHRSLPVWHGCRRLNRDEFFPLMRNVRASFDGRYFGPVTRASILGRLIPLWTK